MILRYPLVCASCTATIRLRVAVHDAEFESFQFGCSTCGQSISGAVELDRSAFTVKGLAKLSGATVATTDPEPMQTHTVDRRFAEVANDDPEDEFSSFMAAFRRYGGDFIARVQDRQRGLAIILDQRGVAQRLWHTYSRDNWTQFEAIVREQISDDIPLALAVDRQAALYLQLQWVVTPIFGSASFNNAISATSGLLAQIYDGHPNALSALLNGAHFSSTVATVQAQAFEVTIRLLDAAESFRLGLFEWDREDPAQAFPTGLVMRTGAQFHFLKSLYVDAYETACRGITLAMALLNLRDRADANVFSAHPTLSSFKPKSLTHFHGLSNAPKLALLSNSPFAWWAQTLLDPRFRNAIGHHSTTFNDERNEVVIVDKHGEEGDRSISYGEFQFRILRAVLAAHHANHLVKMLNVYRWMAFVG